MRSSVARASRSRPTWMSHFGLSGIGTSSAMNATAGSTSAASIQRHPARTFQASSPSPWIMPLMNRVTKIPETMPSWNSVPRRPRQRGGAISAM